MSVEPIAETDVPDEAKPTELDGILERLRQELGQSESIGDAGRKTTPIRTEDVLRVPRLSVPEPDIDTQAQLHLRDFERLSEDEFIKTAYRALLGREVDASGLANLTASLRARNTTYATVLDNLRRSPEGQAQGTQIGGIAGASLFNKPRRIPFFGRIYGFITHFMRSPRRIDHLHNRIMALESRQADIRNETNQALERIERALYHLKRGDEELSRDIQVVDHAQSETRAHADLVKIELMSVRDALSDAAQKLAETAAKSKKASHAEKAHSALETAALDALYLAFEGRFRGTPDEISNRLLRYIPLMRTNPAVLNGAPVLDIGSGRGEWLTHLGNNNIAARGVDLNGAMVTFSRDRGLDVQEGDAIRHLSEMEPESLGAVTGFHIIEHLPFSLLVGLLASAKRALRPGGFILFETPNPENLVVGACTFHYDPTHNHPLPPDVVRFLAEEAGFVDVRIIRTDADCDLSEPESGFAPTGVDDWFRQPADYAIYAAKPQADAD